VDGGLALPHFGALVEVIDQIRDIVGPGVKVDEHVREPGRLCEVGKEADGADRGAGGVEEGYGKVGVGFGKGLKSVVAGWNLQGGGGVGSHLGGVGTGIGMLDCEYESRKMSCVAEMGA